jgi:hypothetical protein
MPDGTEKQPTVKQKAKENPHEFQHRDTVFAFLKLFGIARMEADFDGQDKSGEITQIRCTGLPESDQLKSIELDKVQRTIDAHLSSELREPIAYWVGRIKPMLFGQHLQGLIDSMCYDMLEETDINWRYGEGGSGTITINVSRKSIKIDFDERVMTTKYSAYKL